MADRPLSWRQSTLLSALGISRKSGVTAFCAEMPKRQTSAATIPFDLASSRQFTPDNNDPSWMHLPIELHRSLHHASGNDAASRDLAVSRAGGIVVRQAE